MALGLALAACGGAGPGAVGNQLAAPPAGTIAWPITLDHPSTEASHRQAVIELFAITGVRTAMDAAVEVGLSAVSDQPGVSEYREVIIAFLRRVAGYDAIEAELVALYTARFDELTVRQIIAFYETEAGVAAIAQFPDLIRACGELGQRRVREHLGELPGLIAAEARRRAAHP